MARAGVVGEILIVDSSDDDTPELARAAGARVLRVPRRGLGRAYIDALPHVRGRWILMGDADCTYDFRELAPFVEGFEQGYEYVMGSRWKGSIERHAMPPLHQYFGTPFTTWILNRLYGSRFSDIHCGMRGITTDALQRMVLHSQSWEYASEMVLKSVQMDLRTTEVPVTFLKDRDGRVSHHRREGWWSPFKAAWINLRAMFVHGADFFLLKPGILVTLLGLLLVLPATFGAVDLGGAAPVAELAVPRRHRHRDRLPDGDVGLHRPGPVRLHGAAHRALPTHVPLHPDGVDRDGAGRRRASRCSSRWWCGG